MPLDPSIALGVKPAQFMTPMDAISLQGLSRQNQLGELQLEEAVRARKEQEGLRSVLQGPGAIDPATGTISLEGITRAYQASPEAGMKLSTQRQASLKSIAELRKLDAETIKLQLEGATKQADLGKQVYESASIAYDQAKARGIPEEQAVAAGRAAMLGKIDDFERGGMAKLAGFTPEAIAKARGEAPDPGQWRSRAQTYTQFLTDLRAQQGDATTRRGQDMTDTRTREEGAANRGVTVRGQNLADDRAREAAERAGLPSGYRKTPDGNLEPIPGGPATKLGEGQVKQEIGVWNTKNAITRYREALKGWSAMDIALPDARARMGTVYNDMLLQAKEAYNLGVLNGPDYKILQEVITNPASLQGGITSKKALDDQAKSLDEIMSRVATTVANAPKQKGQSGKADPLTKEEEAELAALRTKHRGR